MRVPACPPRYELILTESTVLDASIHCPRSCLLHLKCKRGRCPGNCAVVKNKFLHLMFKAQGLKNEGHLTSSSLQAAWSCPC